MKPSFSIDDAGFTIPEVMISSLLLVLVVINSTRLFMRSQSNIQTSSLRDASYALIAKDVEYLRAKAYKFGCEGLNDDGSISIAPPSDDPTAASCTGLPRDASKPLAYKTARATAIEPYKTACTSSLMAQELVDQFNLPEKGVWTQLQWTGSGTSSAQLPSGATSVSILREISPSRNQLAIAYKTSADSPIKIQLATTLIPQAVAWCP
jgi:type II secretory pathway component PulJ